MKALREAKELLIDVKIDVEKEGVEQFGYIETKLEIIIAELEALQQPKSCEGCRWSYEKYINMCDMCERNYDDRYKVKEQ